MAYNSPPNPDPLNQPPMNQPPSPGGGYQGNPYGYQGTPTPTGYQDPSQFGQPPYSNRSIWSANGPGIGGGLSRILLTILLGPGALRPGQGRFSLYARIAFWLIIIGICLYVGFTKHTWIITCTGNDCGD
jgi:hypothetical protein